MSGKKKQAVVALNGIIKDKKKAYQRIYKQKNFLFIGADGGSLFLDKIDITPDIIIGDMDSLTKKEFNYFKNKKVTFKKYFKEKEETDGELALNYCIENNIDKVFIIGTQGGRFDQQLANIFLLEYAVKNNLKALVKEPNLEAGIIQHRKKFIDYKNIRLSLLPLSSEVKGVNIKGCKYEATNTNLYRYKTRGISNIINKNLAEVTLDEGLLLYIIN